VLDALPKRLQGDAKKLLHEMMEAPSRADFCAALERFHERFDAKYPKAVAKLDRDWAHLTAFYDFPARYWRHLRTSNAIEPSFATVKLRTRVTKARDRRRPRSRWPTSCSAPPRSGGGGSTATSRLIHLMRRSTTLDNCSIRGAERLRRP
jgi:Transposase, Mutator family